MGRAATFTPPDLITTGVLARAKADNQWTNAEADEARNWYEHFLELCWDTPGGSAHIIASMADELWHTHITFTAPYRNYCLGVLGYFLDHTPVIPRRPASRAERSWATQAYKRWGPVPDMIVQCRN